MASYKELQDKIAELSRQAEEARTQEIAGVIQQIQELMSDYDITVADLEANGKKKGGKPGEKKNVQFRNSEGQTWSGRGRMPHWLAGQDKEQFRVA